MPGPKIIIAGDASGATRAFNEAIDGAQRLGHATDAVSAGFGRAKIAGLKLKATGGSFGAVAAGLVVASQASKELSNSLEVSGAAASTTEGRIRNAGAAILSGNFVGAIKALGTEAAISDTAMGALAQHSLQLGSQVEIDAAKAEAASLGWKKLSSQLDEVSASATGVVSALAAAGVQAQLGGVAARTGLSATGSDAAQFGEQSGRFGRGAGSVSESNSRAGGALADAIAGLSQRLQTAISGARAGGNKQNLIAQLKRGRTSLQGQLGQSNLTDADRQKIYDSIYAINSEITGLTKDSMKSSTKLKKSVKDLHKAAADALEKLARELQRKADDFKSEALRALDNSTNKRDTQKAVEDAVKNLAYLRQLGAPDQIKNAQIALADAKDARTRAMIESGTVTAVRGGGYTVTIGTLHLTGIQNVKQLLDELQKRTRHSTSQQRGRMPGHHLGLN